MEPGALHLTVFCGIDWAEDHHDVALVDAGGAVLARLRISDDAAGYTRLLALLATHGDTAAMPVPVAIETPRGLLVACLRATGRTVFAVNPMAVARYRERHSVAGKKSDALDAAVLANILRTDMHAHRPMPADTELAQAIAVLARAQQDAVWDRTQAHNKLRSVLREFYPALLAAFIDKRGGILRPDARMILAAAPTPILAAKLTKTQLAALLKRAGRKRGTEAEAVRLQIVLRAKYLHQPRLVEDAYGRQTLALLRMLDAACANADELETEAATRFVQHPDAAIITSLPGLGPLTGARVLAEIGDDRSRFADARSLKAYSGAAPVTRASGKSRYVMTRRVKNQRLASRGRIRLGVLRAQRLTRSPRPLRPPPQDQRTAHRRTTKPVQPPDRRTAPPPANQADLRRAEGLQDHPNDRPRPRRLTNKGVGGLSALLGQLATDSQNSGSEPTP